jgi:hypothetical protein
MCSIRGLVRAHTFTRAPHTANTHITPRSFGVQLFVSSLFFLSFDFLGSWADRVKTEVGSAVVWEQDWGDLYRPGQPIGYLSKIEALKQQVAKCVIFFLLKDLCFFLCPFTSHARYLLVF